MFALLSSSVFRQAALQALIQELNTMQASYHIAILSAQELERNVQERIREAEREALFGLLRRQRRADKPNRVRHFIGLRFVALGNFISGCREQQERWVDVPTAVEPGR